MPDPCHCEEGSGITSTPLLFSRQKSAVSQRHQVPRLYHVIKMATNCLACGQEVLKGSRAAASTVHGLLKRLLAKRCRENDPAASVTQDSMSTPDIPTCFHALHHMTSCLPRCDVLTSWAFLLSLQEQEWGGRYTRPFLAVARVWLARLHLRKTRLPPTPHVQVASYLYCGVGTSLHWLIVYREQEVTVTEGYTRCLSLFVAVLAAIASVTPTHYDVIISIMTSFIINFIKNYFNFICNNSKINDN